MGQAEEKKKKKFRIPPNPQIPAPHPYLRHMQVLNERRPIQHVFVFKSTRRKPHFGAEGTDIWRKKESEQETVAGRGRDGAVASTHEGGRGFLRHWSPPPSPTLDSQRCCTNKLWCFMSEKKKKKSYIKRC